MKTSKVLIPKKVNYFLLIVLSFLSLSLHAVSPALQKIFDLFNVQAEQVPDLWIQKGKERWEFDKRYEYMRAYAWPLFEQAGYIFEAAPRKERYRFALIYGALLSTAQKRISYLEKLCEQGVQFEQFVFLTGERPLKDVEKNICSGETEADMMKWAYSKSTLSKDIPVVFIVVPMKEKDGLCMRPCTADTIFAWLKTNPLAGNCLGISSQPYVQYQNAVLRSILPSQFDIETAGPAVDYDPSVALILDTIGKEIVYTQRPVFNGSSRL